MEAGQTGWLWVHTWWQEYDGVEIVDNIKWQHVCPTNA
jgi:hypothetical protein